MKVRPVVSLTATAMMSATEGALVNVEKSAIDGFQKSSKNIGELPSTE